MRREVSGPPQMLVPLLGVAFLIVVLLTSLTGCRRPDSRETNRPRNTAEDAADSASGAVVFTDLAGDGTPDFLRLDRRADREAFRRWFAFLAESQYFRPAGQLPAEIGDCAALIRFAYREALRKHTGEWADSLGLDMVPPIPSIAKYHYPHTPLGAALFRVGPGPFRPEDLGDGAFAQFADAKTIRLFNTHFITRDLNLAQTGDLLFFEQEEQEMPFHAMIYLGQSQIEKTGDRFLVYHTGPTGDDPGEIRRPSVEELMHHPRPQWRPVAGNGNFLGVFRWNILKGAL